MTQLFGDTFPCCWIGRQLPGLFRENGLHEIQIEAKTFFSPMTSFLANRVFDLVNNAHRAVSMSYVSQAQADGWLQQLDKAHRQGHFFLFGYGFLVCGEKPHDR